MNIKRISLVPLVFIGLFLLFTILSFNTRHVLSETVTTNVCANGATMLINGTVATSTSVSSTQIPLLSVHTTTSDTPMVTRVQFYINDSIPIGKAVKESTYQWTMPWVAGLSPLDTNQIARITAKIFYNDTTSGSVSSCVVTTPIYVTVDGPRTASLSVAVTPQSWSGPMSYSQGFNSLTQVVGPNFDPTPFAFYEWLQY